MHKLAEAFSKIREMREYWLYQRVNMSQNYIMNHFGTGKGIIKRRSLKHNRKLRNKQAYKRKFNV